MPRPEKGKRIISKILTVIKVDTLILTHKTSPVVLSAKLVSTYQCIIILFLTKATFVLTGFQIA